MTHRVDRWTRGLTSAGVLVIQLFIGQTSSAEIIQGIKDIVEGVLTVPYATVVGTVNGPPLIGTIVGALNGTLNGVLLVTRGALELADAAIGIGLKAAPFVLPFLF